MGTWADIDNTDDVIDSRDVIRRIGELGDREAATESDEDPELTLDEDEVAELQALRTLATGAACYAPDWEYGAQLIRDDYFEEYARQLADDLGLIADDAKWPCDHIDWAGAADDLRQDYTSVDFDGVTYWVR